MKPVLFYTEKSVFEATNYDNFQDDFRVFHNSGNKLFQYSVEKFLQDNCINYVCKKPELDEINSQYSKVIITPANILGKYAINNLVQIVNLVKKIKIPVYFLSIGIQKDDNISIKELAKQIGTISKKLINAVYATGGEFGLRGYITKEFFDYIVPNNTAVVTGCPSIFMNGIISVSNKKVELEKFKPVINGTMYYLKRNNMLDVLEQHTGFEYIDQDEFANELYLNKKYNNIEDALSKCTYIGTKMLSENKIKLFYDIPIWMKYLKDKQFNFSFGSRIHGSILPILCNIPSLVDCIDSRTKEICDFFEIPIIKKYDKNLYELYLSTDYTAFNKTFPEKYQLYKDFMMNKLKLSANITNIQYDTISNFKMPKQNDNSYLKNLLKDFNKDVYTKKYLQYKILHKLTFGKVRKDYKNKYLLIEELKKIK